MTATISLYRDFAVMIGTPRNLISYGTDPVYLTEIGTFEVNDAGATTATSGVIDIVCDFDEYIGLST